MPRGHGAGRTASARQLLRALHIGADAALGAGAPGRAVALAEEALGVDPFDEVATRTLMSAHDALGQSRPGAHRVRAVPRARSTTSSACARRKRPRRRTSRCSAARPRVERRGRRAPHRDSRRDRNRCRSSAAKPSSRGSTSTGTRCATATRARVVIAGEPGHRQDAARRGDRRTPRGRDGALVLWGTCVADVGLPYQPFGELLQQLVTARPSIVDQLGPLAGDLASLVPELSSRAQPAAAAPTSTRARLFRAVQTALDTDRDRAGADRASTTCSSPTKTRSRCCATSRRSSPSGRACSCSPCATPADAPLAGPAAGRLHRRLPTTTFGLGGLTSTISWRCSSTAA